MEPKDKHTKSGGVKIVNYSIYNAGWPWKESTFVLEVADKPSYIRKGPHQICVDMPLEVHLRCIGSPVSNVHLLCGTITKDDL